MPPDLSRDYVDHKKTRTGKEIEDVRLVAIEAAGHLDLIDPRTAAWKKVEKTVLEALA